MARRAKHSGMKIGKSVGARKHRAGLHYHKPGVKHSKYKIPALHTR